MSIIGRLACPWCKFAGAHVKQNEGKRPYHHCPECGYNAPARNGHQAALLTAGMRKIDGLPVGPEHPTPPAADRPIVMPPALPVPAAVVPAPEAPPRRPAGLWDQLMQGTKP